MIQRVQSIYLIISSFFYFLYWFFGLEWYQKGFGKIIETFKNSFDISPILSIISIIPFLIFLICFVYYFTSGMKNDYPPKDLIKKIDELILNKYIGFSFFEIDKYSYYKLKSLKYIFSKNESHKKI